MHAYKVITSAASTGGRRSSRLRILACAQEGETPCVEVELKLNKWSTIAGLHQCKWELQATQIRTLVSVKTTTSILKPHVYLPFYDQVCLRPSSTPPRRLLLVPLSSATLYPVSSEVAANSPPPPNPNPAPGPQECIACCMTWCDNHLFLTLHAAASAALSLMVLVTRSM